MLTIKKVQVVPLDENYGKIIDSFNTQDDKTKNAPSINAVENYSFPSEKIAVIETSITIPSGTLEQSFPIDFPTGFTKSNSTILSSMFSNSNNTNAVWRTLDSIIFIDGTDVIHKYAIELGDTFNVNPDKINITVSNETASPSTITRYFRIVLMRID